MQEKDSKKTLRRKIGWPKILLIVSPVVLILAIFFMFFELKQGYDRPALILLTIIPLYYGSMMYINKGWLEENKIRANVVINFGLLAFGSCFTIIGIKMDVLIAIMLGLVMLYLGTVFTIQVCVHFFKHYLRRRKAKVRRISAIKA